MLQKSILTLVLLFVFTFTFSQENPDSLKKQENPVVIIVNDSANTDSVRLKFIADSIAARQKFIQDSILAREQFIKDSLAHRKRILDSVSFLSNNLPRLINAVIKAKEEEIVIFTEPLFIVGDSALSNFTYRLLTQKIDKPYAPWRRTISLTGESLKLKQDTVDKKITYLRILGSAYTISYDKYKPVIVLKGRNTVIKKQAKTYYKMPFDSVFFDTRGRVIKIKKYARYYTVTKNYQKGNFLFLDLEQVKEFSYFPDGVLSNYKVLKYCGRWSGNDQNKLCHTVTYSISREGKKFKVVKKNIPENVYSDAVLIFEFDNNFDLKSMELINAAKTLSKKCYVELNEEKNVKRYLYEKDGKINRTILVNYNNNPDAKHKVETIVCYFEDDGISYFQKNLTTGKSRRRDKLTLKWSPWK